MYKEVISPVLDRLPSEQMHVTAREALHLAEQTPFTLKVLELLAADHHKRFRDEKLNVVVGGVSFDNPVLVGAGWDKKARAVKALYRLGFSGIEVGSVLEHPQPGNEKPRQFMIGPGVALNRLGFNSPGMEVVAKNLESYRGSGIPIGISLGKNKEVADEDAPRAHAVVASRLYEDASYFTINVSSPNTPGLRGLQAKGPLTDIVQAVNEAMEQKGGRKPLFVKIAPELTNAEINDVIGVVVDNGLTGIVATNTTTNPDIKAHWGRDRNELGGVSGADGSFRNLATEKIRYIYRESGGKIDIIGVGGINDWFSALAKIEAGAKLLQVVTGIRGEGLAVAGQINRGLERWLNVSGLKNFDEVIGYTAKINR